MNETEEYKLEEVVDNNEVQYKPFYKRISFYIWAVLIISILLFNFNYCITIVSGESMNPTLHNGQILLAERNIDNIERYDIVLISAGKPLIKRVIGLPGETVTYKDDVLYINGQVENDIYGFGITSDFEITLLDDEYFCLGDNRENSADSRVYGPFTKNHKNKIFAKILKRR